MAAGGGGEELGGGRWESAVTQPIRGLARATSTLTPLSFTRVLISHPLIQLLVRAKSEFVALYAPQRAQKNLLNRILFFTCFEL